LVQAEVHEEERQEEKEAGVVVSVPSFKTIWSRFDRLLKHDYGDGAKDAAKQIRAALVQWRDFNVDPDDVLKIANKILDGHGIEPVRAEGVWDRYYGDVIALYVNMGDTYESTLVYDVDKNRWWITSWGDWLEAEERAGRLRSTSMGTLEIA
jgi:hypothetical protein